MVKKVWFTQQGETDMFVMSVRIDSKELQPVVFKDEFPPTEPIDGKRLNIDEAKSLGLTERHISISAFTQDDLYKLKAAVEKAIWTT